MNFDDKQKAHDSSVRTALLLFLELHKGGSFNAALNLIEWLRDDPDHIEALNEALTIWALAGGVLIEKQEYDPSRKNLQ